MNRTVHSLDRIAATAEPLLSALRAFIEVVAFWLAIVLPPCYAIGYLAIVTLPVLSIQSPAPLWIAIGVNIVALVVGHGAKRRDPS